MMLFCAAIRRVSVFLLRFPFLSDVQVFSCEISFVCRLKCPCSGFSSYYRFPGYFCSVDACAISIVSSDSNKSSSALFYVIF